jgi:PadR family transcriptional regulator PadR
MEMADPTSLGTFEQVVLTAILSLGDDAYGVTIHARVEELSRPRKVVLGAVYATLDRLSDKGFVRSWMSEPRPERGGRSRRYFALEPAGERALRDAAATARRICDVVELSWGSAAWQPAKP